MLGREADAILGMATPLVENLILCVADKLFTSENDTTKEIRPEQTPIPAPNNAYLSVSLGMQLLLAVSSLFTNDSNGNDIDDDIGLFGNYMGPHSLFAPCWHDNNRDQSEPRSTWSMHK